MRGRAEIIKMDLTSFLKGPLKKTCEECTKSKVRCSGPESQDEICIRCATRGTECVFRSKMKRGPQSSDDSGEKKRNKKKANWSDEDDNEEQGQERNELTWNSSSASGILGSSEATSILYPPEISWHERRCWNILFSMFKHKSTTENPTTWCWLALQIEKLRKDMERIQNYAAIARLETFVASVHTKMPSLSQQSIRHCFFAPRRCAHYSSVALPARKWGPSLPTSLANTTGKAMQFFFHPSKFPFLEFEMDHDGSRILQVNDRFTSTFGHTKESLEATLAWTGGSNFLPWGGDLVSRLLWSEADVFVFLQVLAIKFQSLAPSIHDHKNPGREVLSAYIFDLRVRNDYGTEEDTVIPCIVKSLHRETLIGIEMKIILMLEFEPLSEPIKGPGIIRGS